MLRLELRVVAMLGMYVVPRFTPRHLPPVFTSIPPPKFSSRLLRYGLRAVSHRTKTLSVGHSERGREMLKISFAEVWTCHNEVHLS